MRRLFVLAFILGAAPAGPAAAQQLASADVPVVPPAGPTAPVGSPSNGTTTVSATAIPEALERADRNYAVSLSLGALYASGDFGLKTNTSIQSYALGARVRSGNWRLSASLPWMRIRSDATLFTGIDSTPVLVSPVSPLGRHTGQGFGDLTLGSAYTIRPAGSATEIELSGRVKFSTATRSSGLSSGKTDYAAGAQIVHTVGAFAPFASVTYRFLGDPAGYRLRNGPAASVGTSYSLSPRALLLVSYHYARAATGLVADSHELFAGASTAVGQAGIRLTGFATAGLSRGAPGVSGGAALSKSF